MSLLLSILGTILLSVLLFVLLVVFIGYLLSSKPYKGPITDHFDGTKFKNLSGRPANGLKQVGEYGRKRQPDRWSYVKDPDWQTRQLPAAHPSEVQYTFINHSTFLIQTDGVNILTDPIWSKRCSPFQWAGPKRMRPPGIAFENLPEIHLVLLSHNHFDHLDKNTIKRLVKKYNPTFVVPLGGSDVVKKYGGMKVYELDWWQEQDFEGMTITATPANHFSSRGLFDRDKTLWAGYTIRTEDVNLYYVGDTGYSDIFEKVGEQLGPFDLSFIPIGAYKPEWFMGPIHISPQQAIQVHKDVGSAKSVAMHFGTFPLADDNPERSKSELKINMEKNDISESHFQIPLEGQTYKLR